MLSSTTTIEPDRAGRADRAPRVERAISTRDAKLWKLWPGRYPATPRRLMN